jgi:hypothetical protein
MSDLFPIRFPHQNPVCTLPVTHTCHIPRPSHYSWFDHGVVFGDEVIQICDTTGTSWCHFAPRYSQRESD